MQDGAPQSDLASHSLTPDDSHTPDDRPSEACRYTVALREAASLYITEPDWMTFFRSILGVEGIVRQLFNTKELLAQFEQSAEFDQIQMMLAELRMKKVPAAFDEPVKMITVRVPASLHEALRAEALDRRTSLNKLCISKLLQVVEDQRSDPGVASAEPSSNGSAPRNT